MNTYHVATYQPDGTLRVYAPTYGRVTADVVADSLRHRHAPDSFVVVPASKPGQLRPFAAGKIGPAFAWGGHA